MSSEPFEDIMGEESSEQAAYQSPLIERDVLHAPAEKTEAHLQGGAPPIEQLEAEMLQLPQAECPVVHHFGPGIYIREVTIPAGTLAIGHAQKFEHLNIMLKGRLVVLDDAGNPRELVAPLLFVGPPGRKVGYVLEDVVWQNVYATEERDIDVLEATYLDKSDTWQASDQQRHRLEALQHEADREDYLRMLDEAGFTHETARAQSENNTDQIPMPPAGARVRILPSPIEGYGLFLSSPVEAGEVIAPARINGMRTPAGRYTNHSLTPNARMVPRESGDIDLVAARRIDGCRGGGPGEEVTIDYRQALALSGIQLQKRETPCLE
jgi:hypothetical protein